MSVPHSLNYNDLRHLARSVAQHEEPTIVVRAHAVVVALAPLRAIVLADKMLLIVPEGADSLLYLLQTHMSGKPQR
jgi:magnesium transporter